MEKCVRNRTVEREIHIYLTVFHIELEIGYLGR